MKKIFLIGAMLIASMTAMGDIIEVIGESSNTPTTKKTVYLPLTITGELVNIKGKVYLRIKPTSNIGPDGSSILFDFGKMVKGDTSTLNGEFIAEVIKNNGSIEQNINIGTSNLWTSFDSGDGKFDINAEGNKKTSSTSVITIAKDGNSQGGGQTAAKVGHIDYTLTGAFEATDKYIGNVQADIRVDGNDAATAGSVGAFIDKTQRVAVVVKNIDVAAEK